MTPYTVDEAQREYDQAVVAGDWARAETVGTWLDVHDPLPLRPVPVPGAAALWYAEQGLKVFPLQPGSKKPFPRSRGLHDATNDPTQVGRWWQAHPTANIGLATGHLVDVIDFDGLAGHIAWGKLFPEDDGSSYGGARTLATVSTPRPGGLHVYIRATGDGNAAGMTEGVDYRGRGGYVVAAPSVLDDRDDQHPGTYRFLRPLDPKDLHQ